MKKLTNKLDIYCSEGVEAESKAQRILANLRTYNILKVLIQRSKCNPEFKELMATLHCFLLSFIRDNQHNIELVAADFDLFSQGELSTYLPKLLEQLFDKLRDKETAFRRLLEAIHQSTDSMLLFRFIGTVLEKASPAIKTACCDFVIHSPNNAKYFQLPINSADGEFYRMLSRLLRGSPDMCGSLTTIFGRKEL